MSEALTSVGLDVGTTSTQMVVSRLRVENTAGAFAVPELRITDRQVIYRGKVHFTPLLDDSHVDGEKLRLLVEREYANAGITRDQVDTGAVIITGETSRKENAETVLEAISHLAGDFVVAVAGPDLESILAARGSGAVEHAEKTGKTVLHMDIGGGTSNLALIREGRIEATGCLNVGGRLVKKDKDRRVTYVSPVLEPLFPVKTGQVLDGETEENIAEFLTEALEMAAGLRPWEDRHRTLLTREAAGRIPDLPQPPVLSFSGGVADCIADRFASDAFGDIGPALGQHIRNSRLCRGEYLLGRETIRATVIGAGSHTTQLSGSTVFRQNIPFPLKNLPVVPVPDPENLPQMQDALPVLVLEGMEAPSYGAIAALAETLAPRLPDPAVICTRQDMAKALGQALALRLPERARILCIDRIRAGEGDYLDIGAPVGAAMPVVVKTLVMGRKEGRNL